MDWIIPGSSQYTRAPGGTVGSDTTYLLINLGRVLAGRNYRYRIQAVNSEGFVSNYVFHELQSSKGSYMLQYMYYATNNYLYNKIYTYYIHIFMLSIFNSSIEAILHSAATCMENTTVKLNLFL